MKTPTGRKVLSAMVNLGNANGPHGAGFVMRAMPGHDFPAFSIMEAELNLLPFGVAGDGTVLLGADMSDDNFEPIAQLDIRQTNIYDNILNIGTINSNNSILRIHNNGNVGIGMPPQSGTRLALLGSGNTTYLDINGTTKAIRFMGCGSTQPRHLITETNGDFVIDPGVANGGGNDKLVVSGDGQVTGKLYVGSQSITSGTHNDARLFVDGKIAAKSCVITTSNWADDVFDENYPLTALSDLKTFVRQNKHLPLVPNEATILQTGIDVSQTIPILLRKIEELTLYVIQLNEEVNTLKNK